MALGQAPSWDSPQTPAGLKVETLPLSERRAVARHGPRQNGKRGCAKGSKSLKRALDPAYGMALGKQLNLSESPSYP